MAKPEKKDASKKSDEEILKLARERFALCEDAESKIREVAKEDILFSIGEQWDDQVKASRTLDKRPCLTINRLPQFIRQITNDQRQNRPAIKVSAVDDQADVETAKIFQGMIRHIEYDSNADVAYDRAFDSAVRCGFGFWRVISEYCDPESFDQVIKIKSVRNRFSVYLDPSSQEPDGSDATFGFIFDDVKREDYERLYPDSKMASMDDWSSIGDARGGWAAKDSVRIAEYYFKEFKDETIYQLIDGSTIKASEVPEGTDIPESAIVNKRKTKIPVVRWLKINAVEVLENTIWPSQYIPIVPVYGDEIELDGERVLEGVVRHAKDPQRMLNVWESAKTEAIALAPRAPFIGAATQFEGYEQMWQEANTRNLAFLPYNPVNGEPPPQRQAFEPAVQAITQAAQAAAENLKATTGIYDASLGNKSNEQSGIAIQRRNIQAQTANFHFIDNLSKAIRHTGRILVDLIPSIYDTKRAIRILGEDGTEDVVVINDIFQDQKSGKTYHYDLSKGTYDVTVDAGPSFQTKRQEAAQSMLEMAKSVPQLMQVAPDLIVQNFDWPKAKEVAERLKKLVPPNIAGDDQQQQQLPPQVQQQLQQQAQLIDQLTQEVHAHSQISEMKSLELQSKERIEMAKIQAAIEMKMAELGSKEAIVHLQEEVGAIQHRLEHSLDFQGQIQDQAQHEQSLQAQSQMQGADQQHQQQMQAQQAQAQQMNLKAAGPQGMAASDQQQPTGPQGMDTEQ